jgi:excisionase family DNA binding protein
MSAATKMLTEQVAKHVRGLARVRDAEDFLNVSRATVYNLMENGTLKYVKIGRSRRIAWDALEELVAKSVVAR